MIFAKQDLFLVMICSSPLNVSFVSISEIKFSQIGRRFSNQASIMQWIALTCFIFILGVDWATGIIGGFPSPSFAFFATIRTSSSKFCGGSLIAPDVILTVAHCLYDFHKKKWLPAKDIVITKGDFTQRNWAENAERYSCRRYAHPNAYRPYFENDFKPFDIALLKLKEAVNMTQQYPPNGIVGSRRG